LIVEASVAGQGQGDAGQGEATQQQGPDISALADQIGNLTATQDEMHQLLRSEPWRSEAADGGQEQQAEEPEFELDLSQLVEPDGQYDPAQVAQQFSQQVSEVVAQRVEQGLAPLQEQVRDMRQEREWQVIADQFPELADEQVARPVFEMAKTMSEQNGHPELAQEPWFVRVVYTGMKSLEAAAEEGAEAPSAAHLEGGGGAAPAGSQVDALTQVFGGGEDIPLGRRALPFS
jgi:hypothetical protein